MERAIEIALANPVDFEYAIDKEVRVKDAALFVHLVIDTLPCSGTNFPRQKDSLQPAGQK